MRGGLIVAREVSSEEGLCTQLCHRGETSGPFLLLPSRKTGLINSKGSSRTAAACVSSTWALPGNKDKGTSPPSSWDNNTGSLCLPWATQHPTCEKTSFPRMTQSILRGLQLEYQGWIVLEFGGYVDIQKAETKKMHLSKEIQKVS